MHSVLSKTDGVFHNDPEWNGDQHQAFVLSKNAHMGPVCFWGIKSYNIISYLCSVSALEMSVWVYHRKMLQMINMQV